MARIDLGDGGMWYRFLLLFITCSALVFAVEPVVADVDLMPASERQDGQGGVVRLRVVSRMDARRPLRLVEHRGADGVWDTKTMVADHLLVALRGTPVAAEVQALAEASGCTVRRRLGVSDLWLFAFPVREPSAPDQMRDRLAALPQVRRVEADWQVRSNVLPNDPDFKRQWSLNNLDEKGNPNGADIKAPAAWQTTTGSRSVVVGIIDTGIAYDHPELAANIWANPGETGLDAAGHDKRTNGIDDDGNGYIDDWHGWNFAAGTNDPQDDNGHGSHCAGIIGATGNDGLGITGVCWQVSLVGLKFLDASGSGYTADAVEAIQYADRLGLPITSNSWGSTASSESLREAMATAAAHGMLLVAAAGNTSRDLGRQPGYPAAFPIANLINVAATDRWDQLAYFSAYSATAVHIAAPGADILSTVQEGHAVHSGTSMATPHVTGVAALIKAARPTITASALKQVLIDGVEHLPNLAFASVSGGRLDAARSLALATGPWLRAVDWTIADQDANGVAEPGEWCDVRIVLRNEGLVASSAGTLRIDPLGTETAIATFGGTIEVPSLAPGSTLMTSAIRLSIAPEASAPHDVFARASIAYGAGREARLPIAIAIRRATALRGVVRQISTDVPVANARVYARGAVERSVPTGADGSYTLVLPEGDFTVAAEIPGQLLGVSRTLHLPPSQVLDLLVGAPHVAVTPTLTTVTQGERATIKLPIANTGDLPLHWTLEVDQDFNAEGQWHRSQRRSPDGDPVWWFGQEETGNFATGAIARGALIVAPVEVPRAGGALSFWSWRNTEPEFPEFTDTCTVELSVDGGTTWTTTLAEIIDQNESSTWTPHKISLNAWAGKTVRLRFVFDSVDAFANEGEGWYVGAIVACGRRLEPRGWSVPASGTILPGTTGQVQLTLDTHDLASGSQDLPVWVRSDDPSSPLTKVALPLVIAPAAVPTFLGAKIREVSGDGDGWAEYEELIALDLDFQNPGDLPISLEVSLDPLTGYFDVRSAMASGTIPAHGRTTLTGITVFVQTMSSDLQVEGSIQVFDGTTRKRHPITFTIAQRDSVRGRIVDANGGPIAGARISLEHYWQPTPATQTSGQDGLFVFPDLYLGQYRLTVSQAGRSPEAREIDVPLAEPLTITLGERRLRVDTTNIASVLPANGQETQMLSLAATGDVPVTCRILSSAAFADYLVETSLDVDGPTYAWATLPPSSASLPITAGTQGPFPIGFPFPFYGTSYGTFHFSGAGWLSFTDQHDQYYGYLDAPPFYALPRALIAPWMGTPQASYFDGAYRYDGNEQRLLVEISHALDLQGDEVSHQTILEANGTITVHYQQVGESPYTIAGIQNPPASKGLGIYGEYGVSPLMNPTWKPKSASAVRYRPAAKFITLPPTLVKSDGGVSVTIPPHTSLQLPLLLSANQQSVGISRDRLVIISDVLDHPWVSVPVTLTVTVTDPGTPVTPLVNDNEGSSKGCGVGSGLGVGLIALGGFLGLRRRRFIR